MRTTARMRNKNLERGNKQKKRNPHERTSEVGDIYHWKTRRAQRRSPVSPNTVVATIFFLLIVTPLLLIPLLLDVEKLIQGIT